MTFSPEINSLIKDLDGPDYITNAFSDIGVESLVVLRSVFRIDKAYLGNYLARTLYRSKSLVEDKSVLDLGCGCGLLGLICAKHNAENVHFSDIHPPAVKNSRINALLMDVDNVSFSTGDLFDNIPTADGFDLIIFNSPAIAGVPESTSEAAFVREDRVIIDFFRMFPRYLRDGGQVIMPGSSRFNSDSSPMNIIRKHGLRYEMIAKEYEDDGNYKYVVLLK